MNPYHLNRRRAELSQLRDLDAQDGGVNSGFRRAFPFLRDENLEDELKRWKGKSPPSRPREAIAPPAKKVPTGKKPGGQNEGHAQTCPSGQAVTHHAIPAEYRRSILDPRLSAIVLHQSGVLSQSKHDIEETLESVLEFLTQVIKGTRKIQPVKKMA